MILLLYYADLIGLKGRARKLFGVKSGYENHPAVAITWFGAKAYCDYYGWRLPMEIEARDFDA